MISSKLFRSSVVASFACLTLFACERDAQQQGGAAGDMTSPATGTTERQGSPATGTTGNREGTTAERSPGTGTTAGESDAIERTGGRDMPMGAGGSTQGSAMGTGGTAGRGGAGGAAGTSTR